MVQRLQPRFYYGRFWKMSTTILSPVATMADMDTAHVEGNPFKGMLKQ